MDQSNNQNRSQEQMREQKNYARPKRMEWIRRTNQKLRIVRGVMVGLCGMIAVVAALLLILPAFKVKDIDVVGVDNLVTTTEDEIIAASGIQIGTEIVGTNWKIAANNIEKQCLVKVDLEIQPFKVIIRVKEKQELRMQYGDYWVSLDENFHVLNITQDEEELAGLLQVKLPNISSIKMNEPLKFTNEETDLEYVKNTLEFLENSGMMDRVDLLDASEKFNVSCTLDGTYRVVLGKIGDLERKLQVANEIISLKNGKDSYAVIDVSDAEKSIYRPIQQSELLLANR